MLITILQIPRQARNDNAGKGREIQMTAFICHPERNEAKRSEVERSVVKSRFLPPAGGQA
ncbi:hypothetical protein A2524_00545 [Candidatus Wolfebacteria bacterium RIFOXYD12_FULL_48_21]|uniref:Uncharacterized protein n=1 Tax=Candidatus Wolfebacteria bacterium RIFOXYD1_FULL_48_65 TaxID=1802561 RepID=A0A1F8DZ63_9BACT|nr:MAG: hypothetical protein A2610_00390 [Candidatus Wolfebacteria bacterium RIFOXYD1_FULL_48_65]OGM94304.1 MAG: hypothetical protein A2524_00545 [Candidatus Wolfebacteria bacterium RIFOXYD12_FULL_48_21]